jgi:uncharacterized membrane protein
MKAGSVISYILAAIFIVFSFLLLLGAGGEGGSPSWIIYGIIGLILGFVLIFAGVRLAAASKQTVQNVTYNVDLPGNVQMDTIKCQACGAPLAPEDIKVVNGAVMVQCHSCGTTYQITEEPKW